MNNQGVIEKADFIKQFPNDASINTVTTYIDEQGCEWELVTVKLDSGASEWVFNPLTAQYFKICETVASAHNINFTAANGTAIKNHGLRSIKALTNEGNGIKVDVNVADVRSNLASGMRRTQTLKATLNFSPSF